MVRFEAPRFIWIAIIVWLIWRLIIWRRRGGDPVRELVVASLFGWTLIVFYFTFFPMTIIFYSWFGRINLVPFASILQLIRETSAGLASFNIVGNLLLLAPLGILLPLLFEQLQRPWPLIWRVAVISAFIETSQFVTRARAVDVDDIILNTLGAAMGFGIYRLLAARVKRSTSRAKLLERVGISTSREPLLLAAMPIALTAALALPMIGYSLVGATLGDGSSGIIGHAIESMPAGKVVGRFDVNEYTMLILESESGSSPEVGMWMYQKVLPGRFTWISSGTYEPFAPSGYRSALTSYNVDAGELPTYIVWGRNGVGATTVVVDGNEAHEELPLADGEYFATGFYYEPDFSSGSLETFEFRFTDASGNDVTGQFAAQDG